jgi:hypothetical protein
VKFIEFTYFEKKFKEKVKLLTEKGTGFIEIEIAENESALWQVNSQQKRSTPRNKRLISSMILGLPV